MYFASLIFIFMNSLKSHLKIFLSWVSFVLPIIESLFCPVDVSPSHFSVPLCLTLLILCVFCHSAIWCWCQIQYPENSVPASVTELLQQVSQHENKIMDNLRKALENPPSSVSDISESMDDLEVEQAGSGCCGDGCKEADCCRRGENMDLDSPHQPQKLHSGCTDCCCSSGESLNHLLQRCIDIVSELGLPQELIGHIQELKNTQWLKIRKKNHKDNTWKLHMNCETKEALV